MLNIEKKKRTIIWKTLNYIEKLKFLENIYSETTYTVVVSMQSMV
jgi:hypothetical protein